MGKKILVIAGGGTGGHIYPGISIGDKLKDLDPAYDVHFIGAKGGLEEEIVPRQGYPLHLLRVGRLHASVGLWRRVKTLLGLPLCFIQALLLCLRLRPKGVIGIGGFASGPFVFVASLLGFRTALLEPNAMPGMTNRYLARWVSRCFVVFEEALHYFPASSAQVVGLPVRFKKQTPQSYYNGSRPLRVLVFGGSQGAQGINRAFASWWRDHCSFKDRLEVFHQVGGKNIGEWKDFYGSCPQGDRPGFTVADYIHDMPQKLAWADVCICRAGVGTVVELAMTQTPALFVPLPTAADNHQEKNAQVVVTRDGGWLRAQKDLNSDFFHQFFVNLFENPAQLEKKSKNLSSINFDQSAESLLRALLGDQLCS